jgi:thioredoxin 2
MKTYTVCPKCGAVNGVELPHASKAVCEKCKAELKSLHDGVNTLTAVELNRLIDGSPLPVVADFWAPWCGPCLGFAPIFAQAARELTGNYVFVKVDTQADPSAGELFRIEAIPTLSVLSGGVEQARQMGGLPLTQFKLWLEDVRQAA